MEYKKTIGTLYRVYELWGPNVYGDNRLAVRIHLNRTSGASHSFLTFWKDDGSRLSLHRKSVGDPWYCNSNLAVSGVLVAAGLLPEDEGYHFTGACSDGLIRRAAALKGYEVRFMDVGMY